MYNVNTFYVDTFSCTIRCMTPQTPIEEVTRITTQQKKALKKLGLVTVGDLLLHLPARYSQTANHTSIAHSEVGAQVVLYGRVSKLETTKGFRSKIPMTKARFEDATGTIRLVWFHQPYIAKMVPEGALIQITGKVASDKHGVYIANPDIERSPITTEAGHSLFTEKPSDDVPHLLPVYPESRGITSRWFYYTIQKVLATKVHEYLPDPIPEEIRTRYHLPSLATALVWAHQPQKESDAQMARKRFAFEEIFLLQIDRQKMRRDYRAQPSFAITTPTSDVDDFIARFPFELTRGQASAIETILGDMKKGVPMSRLLEGDVGSGKTAVAAATAYATVTTRPEGQHFGTLQVAIMAPTEILAKQHFESFITYFAHLPIQVGLITSSGCKKFPSKVNPTQATDISKTQLVKWVANGEIPIVIGTHALIQKSVAFKDLAYTIIDEQHRFGTKQRGTLTKKEVKNKTKKAPRKKVVTPADTTPEAPRTPHLLSMTATPIPRTLALTIYGDLDLSLIDTLPKGRKPIMTEMIAADNRGTTYEGVREQLREGRQAYVICPRIDPPDTQDKHGESLRAGEADPCPPSAKASGTGRQATKENAMKMTSVTAEAKRLKTDIFPEYTIEMLHSKMKPKEKEEIMRRFAEHEIDILVATSVVEVGVNVPNATTIIIEDSERFGLAQLHQLRGRVLRSSHQAYCFLVTGSKSTRTRDRLKTLVTAKNGFELAEKDLMLRGAGELAGTKQWGISDLGMEAIKNIKMVEAAREEARNILEEDPELSHYPDIKKRLTAIQEVLHLE